MQHAHETFEAFCERVLPPAEITVSATPLSVGYHNDTPLGTLTGAAGVPGRPGVTLGNASSALTASFGSGLTVLRRGLRQCLRPSFSLTLSAEAVRVEIAREFVPGSCAYQHILEHEDRHVAATRQHLQDSATWIETRLREQFGGEIIYLDAATDSAALLEATVRDQWLPLLQQKFAEVRQLQEAIDTPEEYARNDTVCGGAISQAVLTLKSR